jgi:carbon monoxide dehydrogenase subunit G
MKIKGRHSFDVSREVVWQALLDPEVLAKVLPGCEELRESAGHTYRGSMNMKVGPVQGQFRGTVKLSDVQPPESYRLDLEGRGAAGFVDGGGAVRLEESGAETIFHYDMDVRVGGRIAGVGQRLLDSSARVITRQALQGLGDQLQARAAAEAAGEPAPELQAPSQAAFAAGFAKGLLEELIPRERRPMAFGIAAAILALLVILLLRRPRD